MLAVYFDCPGGPENLYVKEVMKPQPGEGEVLVKVSASALNRADLLQVGVLLSRFVHENMTPIFQAPI